jgi:alkanesulfonate monooxygenase SsuD/methylene tetrahydromethanopterin reductase-like flavin-dependent oxidoreductase (luciferase family)
VRFGFGLITCQRYPGDPRSDVELYADALELAAETEQLGFDSVWTSEHHFVDDAYVPSVLALCAAIAARTDRVLVGTALLLAPLHEPLRVAEDAAVVDMISGGRLVLGIGLGWREEEFDALHVPIRERVGRLEDSIEVYRQAWRGDLVTGGARVRYPDVAVRPRPACGRAGADHPESHLPLRQPARSNLHRHRRRSRAPAAADRRRPWKGLLKRCA